jgi:hypothetical protein
MLIHEAMTKPKCTIPSLFLIIVPAMYHTTRQTKHVWSTLTFAFDNWWILGTAFLSTVSNLLALAMTLAN